MSMKEQKKSPYIAPRVRVEMVKLECSIAASSAMVSPGGDTVGSNPWITEETEEVITEGWDFID